MLRITARLSRVEDGDVICSQSYGDDALDKRLRDTDFSQRSRVCMGFGLSRCASLMEEKSRKALTESRTMGT